MPITSTHSLLLGQSARLVIDCSAMFAQQESETETQVRNLLEWVSSCSERANIHIVLGGYRNHKTGHRLHSRLQAMGCTVIARHAARKA
jgi:hypothetical protein